MSTQAYFRGRRVDSCGGRMQATIEGVLEDLWQDDCEPLVASLWFKMRDPKTGEHRWRWWGHPRVFEPAVGCALRNEREQERRRLQEELEEAKRDRSLEKRRNYHQRVLEMPNKVEAMMAWVDKHFSQLDNKDQASWLEFIDGGGTDGSLFPKAEEEELCKVLPFRR